MKMDKQFKLILDCGRVNLLKLFTLEPFPVCTSDAHCVARIYCTVSPYQTKIIISIHFYSSDIIGPGVLLNLRI